MAFQFRFPQTPAFGVREPGRTRNQGGAALKKKAVEAACGASGEAKAVLAS